jgi:hypothetical protein
MNTKVGHFFFLNFAQKFEFNLFKRLAWTSVAAENAF